ncbi:hypothetical protein XA68_14607 [Ophiocordyceps unilateralis]|uniref:Terpene synthase n=1 Tax=Ophiocordyceps unilateralis TaxID=268505 RepID=A0A2A9PMV0_OPHUN|nr:hypothetical protein XA68_14607 [Ophiocordyceps unilateralis]
MVEEKSRLLIRVWAEMDAETSPLANDFEAAEAYRQETIDCFAHCLRLGKVSTHSAGTNAFYDFLEIVGNAVYETHGIEHRELLLSEFKFTVEATSMEQKRRLNPMLPTPRDYMATRMGTSAVNITSLLNGYANGFILPIEILMDPEMRVVWDQTNLINWSLNDLLSLHKEIGEQTVDSLVPLLFHQSGDLKAAVSQVVEIIQGAVQRFDIAATALTNKFAGDSSIAENLSRYIDACRKNCTGGLYWSLRTARYGHCS